MKQIKTIYNRDPAVFDDKVNKALEEGWGLVRRTFDAQGFLAEMEREIITEAERCCENCAHFAQSSNRPPCDTCSEDCSNWEAAT